MSNIETLKTDLYNCFVYLREHNDMDDREDYFARNCANAIKSYTDAGILNTADTGTHTTGNYIGVGISTLSIDYNSLYNGILEVCRYMWEHRLDYTFETTIVEYFASKIAQYTKLSFTNNEIKGTTTGTITSGTGSTTPYTAQIKGTFIGDEITNIHDVFIRIFAYMWNNRNLDYEGDLYLADKWSEGIDNYFKTATQTLSIDDSQMSVSSCVGRFI